MNVITEIFNDAFWYAAPILVALSTTVTGVINQLFKVANNWKQPISWFVGAGLACGSIGLGFIGEGIKWLSYVEMSIVVELSSNEIYDIEEILTWFDSWFTKKSDK